MVCVGPLFAVVSGLLAFASAIPTKIENRASELSIGDIINALSLGFFAHINVSTTFDPLPTNPVPIDFDLTNLLPVELTFDNIQAEAGVNGETFITFNQTFPEPGLVLPPLSTVNSGTVDNVLLVNGTVETLGIIPLGFLDLLINASIRAITVNGDLGIPIALNGLNQRLSLRSKSSHSRFSIHY
ncbi:hypothetical protein BDZ97DRAFT_1145968 [Flammula alnicola]|nr:hypothetical protein BDZ97DRAFT_1145968 [Flammula alnicola]